MVDPFRKRPADLPLTTSGIEAKAYSGLNLSVALTGCFTVSPYPDLIDCMTQPDTMQEKHDHYS
jgi:hypothetical protein